MRDRARIRRGKPSVFPSVLNLGRCSLSLKTLKNCYYLPMFGSRNHSPQYSQSEKRAVRLDYVISLAAVAICTAIAIAGRDDLPTGNFAIVYMLGVLIVSVRCRRRPAILNAVLSSVAF